MGEGKFSHHFLISFVILSYISFHANGIDNQSTNGSVNTNNSVDLTSNVVKPFQITETTPSNIIVVIHSVPDNAKNMTVTVNGTRPNQNMTAVISFTIAPRCKEPLTMLTVLISTLWPILYNKIGFSCTG